MKENLVNTAFEDDVFQFAVSSVDSVKGDCNVSQRKKKAICIYDLDIKLSVKGTHKKEEKDISGSISLPEFFHDQDDDEYVFSVDSEYSSEIKKHLLPLVKSKLVKFQDNLIQAHEKDVQHATGN